MLFTWSQLGEILKGTWLICPEKGEGISAVLDDSRAVTPGTLFVAIVGETADGHKYIVKAAESGASAVCVQRRPSEEELHSLKAAGCGCLLVADGMAAFHQLALNYRLRFPELSVLGVTGSCGKTSTKEMCASVLSARWNNQVLKTQGNTNNFFGVPRNLFGLTDRTRVAVLEAGSNHPGEIAVLGKMIRPNVSVISCIGAAHLEFFKDLNGVAEEKGDLFEATAEDGVCVMPVNCVGKDILLRHAGKRRVITFGLSSDADVQSIYGGVQEGGFSLTLVRHDTGEQCSFVWNIGSEVQACNAAAAAAVGIAFGLTLEEIACGLKNVTLPGARMAQCDVDGVHYVNDAYNANPSSTPASLRWFKEISAKISTRVICLGDMLELGASSLEEHRKVLSFAKQEFPQDTLVTVGKIYGQLASEFGVLNFPSVQEALSYRFPKGSWVFLKGSLGTALYRLVPEKKG